MARIFNRRSRDGVVVLLTGFVCIFGAVLCSAESDNIAAFVWSKVIGVGMIVGALGAKWSWDARGVVRLPQQRRL